MRGRWYFVLRATATVLDYAVYWSFVFAYIHYFGKPNDQGTQEVQGCGHFLVLSIAWALWLPLMEGLLGRSFGKWTCDLRVTTLHGKPISVGQAFVRRLLDPIDLLSFFGLVAYIVAKNTPLSQRLGDLVAKTRVIED